MLWLLLAFGTWHLNAVAAAPAAKDTPPNIVFILADDLGYGDLGCYGQEKISTPNLDRLAADGIRFTDAYAGAATCAPSRCTLMTGLHLGHARVRGNGATIPVAAALQAGDITIADILQKAGYDTAAIGKWGLGDIGKFDTGLPRKNGFDYFYGYLSQRHAHNSYPSFLWQNETKVSLPNIVPNELPSGAGISSNKAVFSDDLFMDEGLKFIRQARQPFFLYFATTLPHANNESKPIGMEIDPKSFAKYADRDWPLVEKDFAAMVSRLDEDAGRLLALLKELHLDKNTIVIFASDNGAHAEGGHDPTFFHSTGPLRGIKRDLYEGGIRIPLIASWPGHIPAGRTEATPIFFPDFMPTLATFSGATLPAHFDGSDVSPLLLGHAQPELQRAPYWEGYDKGFQQAVRLGKWKGVRLSPGVPIELYDLQEDIGEKTNVAGAHPEIVALLTARLDADHVSSKEWDVIGEARAKKPVTE